MEKKERINKLSTQLRCFMRKKTNLKHSFQVSYNIKLQLKTLIVHAYDCISEAVNQSE